MEIRHHDIHKILVIKLRAIGDVVLSTVVLSNLRAAFPNAQIDVLTEKASREVIEGIPCVNSSIIFDPIQDTGLSLILNVRQRRYDCIIDLFGNPRSALVTLLSGARYRVGYRFGWRRFCYNRVVEPRGGEVHNTEFNLDALKAIGVPIIDRSLSFALTPEAQQLAEEFFSANGLDGEFVVALNPGGGWYTKRWRNAQFAALADRIALEFRAKIILIWGPGEREGADKIRTLMNSPATMIPPTNLKELGAILKNCSIVVTNDSGPMHIASALGTPVVAIFGPTNPDLQGPIGNLSEVIQNTRLLCLGCNYTQCPIGNPCMEELTVDDVFAGFSRLVQELPVPVHD